MPLKLDHFQIRSLKTVSITAGPKSGHGHSNLAEATPHKMIRDSFPQVNDRIIPTPDLSFQSGNDGESCDGSRNRRNLVDMEFPIISPKFYHDMIAYGDTRLFPIDSRYPYEFLGGHAINAQNIYRTSDVVQFFKFHAKRYQSLVFYCESASDNRALTIMRAFRNYDRKINIRDYPTLCFPKMYLLESGFKEFNLNFQGFALEDLYQCEIRNFVQMAK